MWGQEFSQTQTSLPARIIPTRVGTSQAMRAVTYRVKDHPHACGDKFGEYTAGLDKKGSSPRVWGQVYADMVRGIYNEDHPHACGDK